MGRSIPQEGGRRFIAGEESGDACVEYEEGRRAFVAGEKAGDTRVEPREEERKEAPPITVYYLRHGESSSDKNDPLRGLTDKGIEQVQEAIRRVASEITDHETQVRLYSSGSERTRQQCIVAAQILHEAGFQNITIDENSLPEKKVERQEKGVKFTEILQGDDLKQARAELARDLGLYVAGPGVAKRVAELRAPKDYMARLRQLESDTGIGAVVHWLMDQDVPAGADTPEGKAQIVQGAIDTTEKWAQRMKARDSKPIVALVFGHASALTAYGARTFGWKGEQLEEIENAEGIKIDFSGVSGEKPQVQPYGQRIEDKIRQGSH